MWVGFTLLNSTSKLIGWRMLPACVLPGRSQPPTGRYLAGLNTHTAWQAMPPTGLCSSSSQVNPSILPGKAIRREIFSLMGDELLLGSVLFTRGRAGFSPARRINRPRDLRYPPGIFSVTHRFTSTIPITVNLSSAQHQRLSGSAVRQDCIPQGPSQTPRHAPPPRAVMNPALHGDLPHYTSISFNTSPGRLRQTLDSGRLVLSLSHGGVGEYGQPQLLSPAGTPGSPALTPHSLGIVVTACSSNWLYHPRCL